jgi:hypothetical protein
MATNPDSPRFLNPMMLWTDASMRALEATLSSSQNIGEDVDRLARTAANAPAAEMANVAPQSPSGPAFASAATRLFADLQRSTVDLMTQGWLQWLSMATSLLSSTPRLGPDAAATRQNLPQPTAHAAAPGEERQAADKPSRTSSATRHAGGRRRERAPERAAMEHAAASAETKRRRGSSRAKPKTRARNG